MSDTETFVPTATLRRWLRRNLDQETVLRLYVNKERPSRQDTVDDYEELVGHGYDPIILPPSVWTIDEKLARAVAPQQVWVLQAGLAKTDVFGYYLTERSDNALCWAAHFLDGPYSIEVAYDQIKATPKIALR